MSIMSRLPGLPLLLIAGGIAFGMTMLVDIIRVETAEDLTPSRPQIAPANWEERYYPFRLHPQEERRPGKWTGLPEASSSPERVASAPQNRPVTAFENGWAAAPTEPRSPEEEQRIREELTRFALEMVNQTRAEAGLPGVKLGHNPAAQQHAEELTTEGHGAHWNRAGEKPYMRFAFHAPEYNPGHPYNAENVSSPGFASPRREYQRHATLEELKDILQDAHSSLEGSPGHLENLLNPAWTTVSIGVHAIGQDLAYVQHFNSAELIPLHGPNYDRDTATLTFIATTQEGDQPLPSAEDLQGFIYYDPLPQKATVGQLARTYCYDLGTPQGLIIANELRATTDYNVPAKYCPRPRDQEGPAPRTQAEAAAIYENAKAAARATPYEEERVPALHASVWRVKDNLLTIEVNLNDLRSAKDGEQFTPVYEGIYTLIIASPGDTPDKDMKIWAQLPISYN